MLQEREKVENLLKIHGSDTLSYFHLQHERMYFFSPSGNSCLSYRIFGNIAIVSGDPVGPSDEIAPLLESFQQYLTTWKLLPFFVGMSKQHIELLKKSNMKISKIGEEAILSLATFDRKNLKKKVKRAARHISELGVEAFFFNSHNLPSDIRKQIEEVSREWIARRGGKEKGFSMTLKRLPEKEDKDCEFVVAVQDGKVLGYLYFVPVYGAKSLSLDHIRSKENVPNGLHEFLIVRAAEYFKENHIQKLSLNFATFANMVTTTKTKLHLRKLFFSLCMKLYKCDSLRLFNEKFQPTWEDRYAAYSSLKYFPNYLRALISAER